MSFLSVLFALIFYVATVIFIAGLAVKIWQYWKTPAPLKIPVTPAPTTTTGVVFRITREVAFFESLFKSNKWIWLFGYMFHVSLALVLLRHFRYFQEPVAAIIVFIQPFGMYAGFAMVTGLLALWTRRFLVERIRYITNLSDHLILALLVAIGGSGLLMRFVSHTNILAVKEYMYGLLTFNYSTNLPSDTVLLVHLSLVATLLVIFPLSKLLHAPGIFFSPTRNQVDNPREKRHLAAWAAELEK